VEGKKYESEEDVNGGVPYSPLSADAKEAIVETEAERLGLMTDFWSDEFVTGPISQTRHDWAFVFVLEHLLTSPKYRSTQVTEAKRRERRREDARGSLHATTGIKKGRYGWEVQSW